MYVIWMICVLYIPERCFKLANLGRSSFHLVENQWQPSGCVTLDVLSLIDFLPPLFPSTGYVSAVRPRTISNLRSPSLDLHLSRLSPSCSFGFIGVVYVEVSTFRVPFWSGLVISDSRLAVSLPHVWVAAARPHYFVTFRWQPSGCVAHFGMAAVRLYQFI